MSVIELDGERWTSDLDAIEALLRALDAPAWHGRSMDALIDSIAAGQINGIEPPYEIRIHGVRSMSPEARVFIEDLARHVQDSIGGWPSRSGGHRKVRFTFRREGRSG